MVLQLFIGLIAIIGISILIIQGRRRRVWSILILAGLCAISYFLFHDLSQYQSDGFVYQWLPYKALKADFNITSTQQMQQFFGSLIVVLCGIIYLNILSLSEKHSLHFNTLILLNFVSFILLASSQDFIQLMFAGSMLSIICFHIPDIFSERKKIFIFGFLSEMAIFMALAIVYSKTQSISISSFANYKIIGWHKDLVACLLIFAIGSKVGLFLLNGQYNALKNILFNRLIGVMILSQPLSGIILLTKVKPLLDASSITDQIFPIWIFISVGFNFISAIFNDNLRSKFIALSLSVSAVSTYIVYFDILKLYTLVPQLLGLNFLTSTMFILGFNATSEEISVSKMGGFWKITKIDFIQNLILSIAIISGFVAISYFQNHKLFLIAYILVQAVILRMIYMGQSRADDMVIGFAKNAGAPYLLPLTVASGWLLWQNKSWQNAEFFILIALYFAVLLLFPTKRLIQLGKSQFLQQDILSRIYEYGFVVPLRFLGRILWLAFDVVVIERNIIGSISSVTSIFVNTLHRLQEIRLINFILSIILGLLLIIIYMGYNYYE